MRSALLVFWTGGVLLIFGLTHSPPFAALFDYGCRAKRNSVSQSTSLASLLKLPTFSAQTSWTLMYVVGVLSAACGIRFAFFKTGSWTAVPLISYMYLIQTSRRLVETRYVCRMTPRPLNAFVLYFGVMYYVLAALSITLAASVAFPPSVWQAVGSVVLFVAASIVQTHSHYALANAKPLVGKYGVPRGGLFEYVCCPHYTAEVLIYASFLTVCPRILTGMVLLFVCANLSVTATGTFKWYRETFDDSALPPRRKAIVPFVL